MNTVIIRFLILAFSIYLVGKLTNLFHIDNFATAILAAILLAAVNAIVRPVMIFLTLPITFLTLGIFLLFINGFCLLLVSKLVPQFQVKGCFTAALASILISIVNMLLEIWII
ncbi:MAG TPA: phage holin family protein [Candidatus Cloacimonadota bacterium]|nr:phage holin family protein [Candidatus Cloacimonadota bacterium]